MTAKKRREAKQNRESHCRKGNVDRKGGRIEKNQGATGWRREPGGKLYWC